MTEQQTRYLEKFRNTYNETDSLSQVGATLDDLDEWKKDGEFQAEVARIAKFHYDKAISYFVLNIGEVSVAERKMAIDKLTQDMALISGTPRTTKIGNRSASNTEHMIEDYINARKPADD